jgi:hypothetical protein
MSKRAARLAWSLWAICIALTLGAVALAIIDPSAPGESTNRFARVSLVAALLAYPTVGALIASRRPRNPIGWLLIVVGLGAAVSGFAAEYGVRALLAHPDSLPGGRVAAWIEEVVFSGLILVGFALVLLLFPHGRLLSRRWRPVAWLAVLAGLLLLVGTALEEGRFDQDPFSTVENPAGIGGAKALFSALGDSGWVLFLFVLVASAISMVLRFRRARGDEREQLKWIAAAASLLIGLWFTALFVDSTANANVVLVLFIVGVALFPVSIGFAIFKYRLYEIDRIINRALVYGALTAGLAGLYFGIVLGLQEVFSSFAGGSDLAIAISTLAVAALFRPARRRIQGFVDRRFYRRRYDAQRTLETFSARLREEIDLDSLGAELRSVVQQTMQPAHVSIWIRDSVTPVVTISGRSPGTREVR